MNKAEIYLIILKAIAFIGFCAYGGAFLGVRLYYLLEDWADRRNRDE